MPATDQSTQEATAVLMTLSAALSQSNYWMGDYRASLRAMIEDQSHLAACLALGTTPGTENHREHPAGLLEFMHQMIGNALYGYHDWLATKATGAEAPFPIHAILIARGITAFVQDPQREIRYVGWGQVRDAWRTTYRHRDLRRGRASVLLMHPASTHQRPLGLLCTRDQPTGNCEPYGRAFRDSFTFQVPAAPDSIELIGLTPQGIYGDHVSCRDWAYPPRPVGEANDLLACALACFAGWGPGAKEGVIREVDHQANTSAP